MIGKTLDGSPLTPGVNVDAVNIAAGLRMAELVGYTSETDTMVVTYALQRHARGEEDGAEQTWLSYFPRDFTPWRMILAAAVATPAEATQ